jgi:hypothetical protein
LRSQRHLDNIGSVCQSTPSTALIYSIRLVARARASSFVCYGRFSKFRSHLCCEMRNDSLVLYLLDLPIATPLRVGR